MKKFLSVLLAVAMIISVVSVVSFAADEFKQVIKYDFEDEKAPDGYQGKMRMWFTKPKADRAKSSNLQQR